MQIIIKGKQTEVQPRLREHIERKVQKLSRLVGSNARIEVTVSEEKTRSSHDRYTVQLAISNNSHAIHSEVSAANANAEKETTTANTNILFICLTTRMTGIYCLDCK